MVRTAEAVYLIHALGPELRGQCLKHSGRGAVGYVGVNTEASRCSCRDGVAETITGAA